MARHWTDDDFLLKLGTLIEHYGRMPTHDEYSSAPGPSAGRFRHRLKGGFYKYIPELRRKGYCDPKLLDNIETMPIANLELREIENPQALVPPGPYVPRNQFNGLLRALQIEQRKTARIIEMDRACIQALPTPTIHEHPILTAGDPETAVLLLSDIHGGEDVTEQDTVGQNFYNMEVTELRIRHIVPKVKLLVDIERKSKPLDELVIFLLGDMVAGEGIYRGQPFYINAPAISQVRHTGRFISETINELSEFFPRVRVETVMGNHGRVAPRDLAHHLSNWDAVLYDQVKTELRNNPRITVINHKGPLALTDIRGLKVGFSHGGYLSAGSSVKPSTAAERSAERWPALLNSKLDICLYGHFHEPHNIQVGDTEVFANGSLVGGNYYSVTQIRRSNPPRQWFFGVHRHRVTWRYKIDFMGCPKPTGRMYSNDYDVDEKQWERYREVMEAE